MKRLVFFFSFCLLISLVPIPVQAQGIDSFFDVFWVDLGGDAQNWNVVTAGGGSGFANGEWFPYPAEEPQVDPWGNMNPVPSWYNQWFYDGKFRPERYKIVEVKFTYALLDPLANGGTDIVINWATPEWSLNPANQGKPPIGFDQNPFIGRAWLTRESWLEAGDMGVYQFAGRYDLRKLGVPFNPEWVSIDVAGYNVRISNPNLPGSIVHYCIPEPATVGLLLVSLTLLVSRRRL